MPRRMVGRRYGFSLLWFIIGGCMIKVLVQVELGRFAISKGMTTLQAMNTIPGAAAGGVLVGVVLAVYVCWDLFQLGGIVGGVGKVVAELGWFAGLGGHGNFHD